MSGIMRIKKLRKQRKLTQGELGAQMGLSAAIVSNWEHEICLPKARDLPLLAQVLGVRIDELFEPDCLSVS